MIFVHLGLWVIAAALAFNGFPWWVVLIPIALSTGAIVIVVGDDLC